MAVWPVCGRRCGLRCVCGVLKGDCDEVVQATPEVTVRLRSAVAMSSSLQLAKQISADWADSEASMVGKG